MQAQLLLRLHHLAAEAGDAALGELVLELLDAAGRVDELQLARVERMASAADIDLQLLAGAARNERVAAAAGHLRFVITGVDIFLHGYVSRAASLVLGLSCWGLAHYRELVEGIESQSLYEGL